jgi:hypothetical protein
MNRLRSLLGRLGAPGVLGLGALIFCIPFYFSALQPVERELRLKRFQPDPLHARPAAVQPVSADSRALRLEHFYTLFPPVEHLGGELDRLYGLARSSGLDLLQGEYRVEKRPAGLVAYRITLPVRGSYSQVRGFAGAVLTKMPIASIDGLRFERKKSADAQLDAQLRVTIYFQPARDNPGESP